MRSRSLSRPPELTYGAAVMRRLPLVLVSFMLALLAVTLPIDRAAACSCAMPGTLEERVAGSTAAFVGTVIDREPAVGRELGSATLYRFEVEGSAKSVAESPVVVRAGNSEAACGMVFEPGQRYLVFAHGDIDRLETNLCTGNEPLAPGEEPPLALEGVARADPTPSSTPAGEPRPRIVGEGSPGVPLPLIAFAAAGLLVSLLAALALGRREG